MFGLRRRAREERAKAISEERLFTIVNHALLRNFGPLGSYSVTMRSAADTDDIFHVMLTESIAKNVTAELAESGLAVVATPVSLEPVPVAPVTMSLVDAVRAAIDPAFGPQVLTARATEPVKEIEPALAAEPVETEQAAEVEESRALVA